MENPTADDPRLVRVLKRYPKGSDYPDASMDVTNLGMARLRWVVAGADDDPLVSPIDLDQAATGRLSQVLGLPLEGNEFDLILHTYIRTESVAEYYSDPTPRPLASPEGGPPVKPPPGMRWQAVRPRNGKEHYVGVPDVEP